MAELWNGDVFFFAVVARELRIEAKILQFSRFSAKKKNKKDVNGRRFHDLQFIQRHPACGASGAI